MEPGFGALVPGGQRWHVDVAESADWPAGHGAQLELEALETLPGGHVAHDVADTELNVPGGQMSQAEPLRNRPAAQDVMLAPLSIV